MKWPIFPLIVMLACGATAAAQDALADVKEHELEDVRERISDLKQSMDKRAAERDRVTAELQGIEVAISEQRMHIKEIEREQRYVEGKKQQLDGDFAEREAHLQQQSTQLAAQVRAAYMSGSQEKIKLLLNQRDPATLGRVMAYYRYLNDYRAENILVVMQQIRRLDELRARIAVEAARLAELARSRYSVLGRLNNSQESRQTLLASLRKKIASEGQEIERLAAQEKDLTRLIGELTSLEALGGIIQDLAHGNIRPTGSLRIRSFDHTLKKSFAGLSQRRLPLGNAPLLLGHLLGISGPLAGELLCQSQYALMSRFYRRIHRKCCQPGDENHSHGHGPAIPMERLAKKVDTAVTPGFDRVAAQIPADVGGEIRG